MVAKTSQEKTLITITVMLVAIIEVLDMTIVNVALPPMMGSLSSNSEEITWVLTSYIVSAAIFMPLTGVLIERLGQKRLLLINIIGFLMSSMLCGIAQSLSEMVLFRTFQGLFGASLVPLSQFILRNTYSKEEQGTAMAIWGMGIMAAPVLGPTLGGYITEALNWRWVFYINLPVCLIAFVLALRYIDETPRSQKKIDWLGTFLMVVSVGSLQIFLDQGNSKDWFASNLISAMFFTFILTMGLFIKRGLQNDNNIINLHLFRDRNFCLSTIMIMIFVSAILGMVSTQPMMLEQLMQYPTVTTGLLMAPRGLASAFTMAIVSKMINRYPTKYLVGAGLIIAFVGTLFMTRFQLHTPSQTIITISALQGIGMGLFFVPLSTLAFSTLKQEETGEATGLFSFGRSLGSSIGISIMSTLISRETQINWNQMRHHLSPSNPTLSTLLENHQLDFHSPLSAKLLAQKLSLYATFNAYIDSFMLAAMGFLIILPFLFFIDEKVSQPSESS